MVFQWRLAWTSGGACFYPYFNESLLGQVVVDLYFYPCINGDYLEKWWSLFLSMYQWNLHSLDKWWTLRPATHTSRDNRLDKWWTLKQNLPCTKYHGFMVFQWTLACTNGRACFSSCLNGVQLVQLGQVVKLSSTQILMEPSQDKLWRLLLIKF